MAVNFEDQPNKVFVADENRIYVTEQPIRVEVTSDGPQGAPGPVGSTGPQGENGRYFVSETEPLSAVAGDAWFNSTTARMYLRYDSFWVETSTSYAGPRGESGYLNGNNIDGGSAGSVYTQNQTINGGSASSVYTQNQLVNGGMAGTF